MSQSSASDSRDSFDHEFCLMLSLSPLICIECFFLDWIFLKVKEMRGERCRVVPKTNQAFDGRVWVWLSRRGGYDSSINHFWWIDCIFMATSTSRLLLRLSLLLLLSLCSMWMFVASLANSVGWSSTNMKMDYDAKLTSRLDQHNQRVAFKFARSVSSARIWRSSKEDENQCIFYSQFYFTRRFVPLPVDSVLANAVATANNEKKSGKRENGGRQSAGLIHNLKAKASFAAAAVDTGKFACVSRLM